jgi:hypothetical protein
MILMNTIFFDEKFFEETGMIFWIFDNGNTECSNEEFYRKIVPGIYGRKSRKGNNGSSGSPEAD